MRFATATLAVLLASTHTAAAQDACSVTFVRTPDDVRHVIESYLANEPRCVATIELRVIPTDDGLYLLAQRPDGRIHERVVPDAQTAAMIVASWVADDWTIAPPPPPPPPTTATPLPVAVPSLGVTETATVHRPSTGPGRWFSFGPTIGATDGGGFGFRAAIDLGESGAWTAGFALSATRSQLVSDQGYIMANDVSLMGTLGRAFAFGRWSLRPAAGLGLAYSGMTSDVALEFTDMGETAGEISVVGEGSLLVSRWLSDRWAASFGPTGTWMLHSLDSNNGGQSVVRTDLTVAVFGGLNYRL